jgi:hypothetical protein
MFISPVILARTVQIWLVGLEVIQHSRPALKAMAHPGKGFFPLSDKTIRCATAT